MIVLDTHAWVWFVDNPDLISTKARKSVESALADGAIYISSISVWEILMLESKKRLSFSIPASTWLERTEKTGLFTFFPVDNAVCRTSAALNLHGDPADRFIAATAVHLGATLVTKDRKLRTSRKVHTLW